MNLQRWVSANPEILVPGQSSTLTWTSTNTDSCVIEPGIGSVAPNESTTVSPIETTIYSITATGPGGTAAGMVTVTVNNSSGIPVVSFISSPAIIEQGESSTLTWSSTNGQFAYISNGIGIVPLNGSTTVSPTETTTYTITVAGPSGIAGGKATTMVSRNPVAQPICSFGSQYENLIPADSSAGYYDSERFSVITGFVQGNNGFPLSDVAITIHGYPELGTSLTDTEGHFSIPVEGGETLTLVYNKEGFITAHRQINVPVNDFASVETIQMIAQDTASTTATFDGNQDTVVTHQSTEVTDEFGSRSCSMIFAGDNSTWLVDEDGNDVQELETITVRASEFTTEDSMPANLPLNSAYTYCAELSIDGTQRVRFDKPVITWVDNFLGFDVGEIVPVGYYDRDRGVWVPSENGVVVKLLDTDSDGIVDALDADGDDQPDDLNTDGSFSDEVTGLDNSQSYTPGTNFIRFGVTHTAPWGCNWPFTMPTDALLPNAEEEPSYDGENCPSENCTVIHEDIPITGTNITLHYSGNRVEGYHPVITVPVSGPFVPSSLNRIVVKVNVAGRVFEQTLDAIPNQTATFEWDGLDLLEMPFQGFAAADVRVGFVYNRFYAKAGNYDRAFAQPGRDISGIPARKEIIFWKRSNVDIHRIVEGESFITKGWTLSTHHQVNCIGPSWLYKGDGSVFRNSNFILDTLVGGMLAGLTNDGVRAIQSLIGDPGGVDVDVSGNLYYPDTSYKIVRKVTPDGWIYTVAGVRSNGGCGGDGGIATEAQVQYARDIAVDRWGNMYIADSGCDVIRKVDANGIITTVAGNGTAGYGGDSGAAIEAMLNGPMGITVDDSGNLYIADYNNHCIRKVDTGGIITTVAGNTTAGYSGNGGSATEAMLNNPRELAIDAAGNIYIADQGNYSIRKIDKSGIITTVAGNGTYGYSADGVLAVEAQLQSPRSVAVDSLGNIYIAEYYRIRKVGIDGILTTMTYDWREYGDDEYPVPVTGGTIGLLLGLEMDSRKNIYFADFDHYRILKLGPAYSFFDFMTGEDIILTDHTGFEHVFTSTGKHLRTINPDSEEVIYEFSYNRDDSLLFISNGAGNPIIIINRDVNGEPVSITSSDGTTIALEIDSNSHLTRATYPDDGYYAYEYTPDGLITSREVTAKGTVAGLVTDASTGAALPEVTVIVTDPENIHTASTSTDGVYSLSGISPGTSTIAFEKPGYIENTDTINIAGGQIYTFDTQLTPSPSLSLTITSPEDGAEFYSSSVTVTGTVSHDADVTVNGIQATVVDSSYSAEIDLNEGPNTITVTAVDIYGQTETAAIQVTLTYLAPTTGISADPEAILSGESSTLSWTSAYADAAVIDQGIGPVPVNGTITVSPAETTTYTIIVTGPGGTATSDVTVNVTHPVPTVSISADPGTILAGDSSNLTWTSSNADTCVIEPYIGPVGLSGSGWVQPSETTTYTITATGPGGTATDSVTVTVTPLITLTITSPDNGLTISRPDVMVQGTVTNAGGNETGVVVNGILAMVHGDQFVANHVPLQEGENNITATATDTAGYTATTSITINAVTTEHYITISADTDSGVSPLETTLRIDGSFSFTESSITDSGPGVVEFLSSSAEEYSIRITTPGIYYFTADVTDDQSNTYTDTVAIVVLDQAELDLLLKAKWNSMRQALINGDIEGALSYHYSKLRDKYEAIYSLLGSDLATKVNQMQDIELICVEDKKAKYRINRDHDIDGQSVTITYYIYFSKNENGLWQIEKY